MISLNTLKIASVSLFLSAGVTSCAHAQAGFANLPPELMQFIGRRASCLDWSRKASDPAARIDDIKSIMLSLKCGDVADDEHVLRQIYAGNPNVLAALDATWTKVVQRLSPRIAVPASDR
jgi:hypothetical protein